MVSGREGYTLAESIIATAIGGLVMLLILSTVQTQTGFHTLLDTRVQQTRASRDAAGFVTSELRSTPVGGVTVAEADRLVFRRSLLLMAPCAPSGSGTYVHVPPEFGTIESSSVAGSAVRGSDGTWTFTAMSYADAAPTFPSEAASECATAGSDTTGAASEFGHVSTTLAAGQLYMLYQDVELRLATSGLYPSSYALYGGRTGSSLTEVVSGFDSGSGFEYHLSTDVTTTSVTSADLPLIDEVYLTVLPDTTQGGGTAPWEVTVRLENAGS